MAKTFSWTVYLHILDSDGRVYVGLTKLTMMKRWNRHVYCAVRSLKGTGTSHFPNAIRKYGKDAFSHHALMVLPTVEEGNAWEEFWIDYFDSTDPRKGFNIAPGGSHTPHPVRNPMDRPDFRKKALASLALVNAGVTASERSVRSKVLWSDPEFREKVTSAARAALSAPEAKEAMSVAQKAAKARPDVKIRHSSASRANWERPEFRAACEAVWKDPEHRERCSPGLVRGAVLNRSKTRCRNGHEYSAENTYVNGRGSRVCRICSRENGRRNMRAKRVRDMALAQ